MLSNDARASSQQSDVPAAVVGASSAQNATVQRTNARSGTAGGSHFVIDVPVSSHKRESRETTDAQEIRRRAREELEPSSTSSRAVSTRIDDDDSTSAAPAEARPGTITSDGKIRVAITRDGHEVVEALDPYELARLYAQQRAALEDTKHQFDFLAVPDWVRLHPLLGAYLAEAFGTFAWTLTLSLASVRNRSIFTINDNTDITSVPIGFMFTAMVFTFGYISGGHFNPSITIAVFLIRQIELTRCLLYILCQLAAAFGAGVIGMLIHGDADIFVPTVSNSYVSSGIFSELIFTFAIAIAVLNIGYSRQSGSFFYGFAIGMIITAGSASVGRISGGAFNPAAATGLQIAVCLTGDCDDLKRFWIYWLAPVVGAVLAALIFSQMAQPDDTQVLSDQKVFEDVTRNNVIRDEVRAVDDDENGETGAAEDGDGREHSHSSDNEEMGDRRGGAWDGDDSTRAVRIGDARRRPRASSIASLDEL